MVDWQQPEAIDAYNDRALRVLLRAIQAGNTTPTETETRDFVLILVRCNYRAIQARILSHLQSETPVQLQELVIPETARTLYSIIQAELANPLPEGLIVLGLESVLDIDAVLTSTNQVREEFRKHLPLTLVLWVNDWILHRLTRLAPDFKSWAATPIKFEISTPELFEFLHHTINSVFTSILQTGAGFFLNHSSLELALGLRWRSELELAQRDLHNREQALDPSLEAGLQFLLGREAEVQGDRQAAKQGYETSLALMRHSHDLEKQGCVLFHLGLWWRQQARLNRASAQLSCEQARDYFQQSLTVFEQGNRPDLVAKFIPALGEVLAQLAAWDELTDVAHHAQTLHTQYRDPVRQAYDLGLLAEVAMASSDWLQVKELARAAVLTLSQARQLQENRPEIALMLDWAEQYHQPWYLFLLAQAEYYLGQVAEAIRNLAIARARSSPESDPFQHLRILEGLRSLYFEQGRYLDAFQLKQEQSLIEFQYNLRAFAGAAHLEPKRQVLNPGFPRPEQPAIVAQEIAASGRQQDLERLLNRLNRADCKLIVLHGESGVGKSSIIAAGLVPLLRYRGLGERDALPLVLTVYTDWVRGLGRRLSEELLTVRGMQLPLIPDSAPDLLNQLRLNGDRNLLTVLIFDQFEEFFTVYSDLPDRHPFYNFLLDCLNLPFVKVILPIREDALHFLLELERLEPETEKFDRLDILNHNILDKSIRYYLGNFSPTDARAVIQSLTERSQFYLEPALVDTLVQELASETGEVRPIELQIVGAQLQTEKITTLAEYQQKGPKQQLVIRSLNTVIQDCGPENEQMARLVLYLLTSDGKTRPLKTRNELITELEGLGVGADLEKLDLVLQVLVGAGLVFQIPEVPLDRYQLVHDYLMDFIRQQQTPEMSQLVSELEIERQLRSLTQEELRQALQQLGQVLEQEQQERQRAEAAEIEALSASAQTLFLSNDPWGALRSALQAGERLWQTNLSPERRIQTIARLSQVLFALGEHQRWQVHSASVWDITYHPDGQTIATSGADGTIALWTTSGQKLQSWLGHQAGCWVVNFSPDGQFLASGSTDSTVKLWTLDGTELHRLEGHKGAVRGLHFSPDGQFLASASADGSVKLWNRQGTECKTLTGHQGAVWDVAFSPDGQFLVSASDDHTVKLWTVNGDLLQTLQGHNSIVWGLCFSPNGQMIAAAGDDRTIRLWQVDGTALKILQGHAGTVWRVTFSPNGQTLASASTDRTVRLWNLAGEELQSLSGHHAGVWSIAFSPDGQTLASASTDRTIILWNLNLEALLQKGQTLLQQSVNNPAQEL